jgi:hypothetical protein
LGYLNDTSRGKEFFAIRKNSNTTEIKWPKINDFENDGIKLWTNLDSLSKEILGKKHFFKRRNQKFKKKRFSCTSN